MKVLVTGGAGFIGSNLVKALQKNNQEIIVLDNLLSGYKDNISVAPNVRFIEGDIRNHSLVDGLMGGIDVIYHLAASVGSVRSIENPFLDAEINVNGTLTILEAARQHTVKKIVISSSAGIFGELKTLPIKEDHTIEPQTPYASSKLYAEKIALAYANMYGIESVCLRYFNVYGPNQRFDAYGNVIPIFVFRMLQGEPLYVYGDGEQTRDFVSVHDVVQANIKAAETKGLSGAFNIASGTRIKINDLINELISISRIQIKIEYQAERMGDVKHSLADISAAKQAFGYHPTTSLQSGLKEYLAWAKNEIN